MVKLVESEEFNLYNWIFMELENSSLVSNVSHFVFVEWGKKLRI